MSKAMKHPQSQPLEGVAPDQNTASATETLAYIRSLLMELERMSEQMRHVQLQYYLRCALDAANAPPE